MRKRERENPCFVCGHYHKFEDGEVCQTCGHRQQVPAEKSPQESAFSTEILPFLYLGSYDNASRAELLKVQGITCILNTVPTCQNLYKNSFTYHCVNDVNDDKILPLEECIDFIERSRLENAKVLVHCMSGQTRSPAIVIAYLMRHKGWKLPESYQWVKDRRSSINLTPAVTQQLQQYETQIFGNSIPSTFPVSVGGAPIGFGFPSSLAAAVPPFGASSPGALPFKFGPGNADLKPNSFVFGAAVRQQAVPGAAAKPFDQNMDNS